MKKICLGEQERGGDFSIVIVNRGKGRNVRVDFETNGAGRGWV